MSSVKVFRVQALRKCMGHFGPRLDASHRSDDAVSYGGEGQAVKIVANRQRAQNFGALDAQPLLIKQSKQKICLWGQCKFTFPLRTLGFDQT